MSTKQKNREKEAEEQREEEIRRSGVREVRIVRKVKDEDEKEW